MFKGSNRKMFRKPGMARRAIGILASSPEIMQAANRNIPVRMRPGGLMDRDLFQQAQKQARFMLSRPGVSYNMSEDEMVQGIYQNLLKQKQAASMNRTDQLKATAQNFVNRIPITPADTQPFALNRDLGDRLPINEMGSEQLEALRLSLLKEQKALRDRPGGKRKDPLTRLSVDEELKQVLEAQANLASDRQRDADLMSQVSQNFMPDGGIKNIPEVNVEFDTPSISEDGDIVDRSMKGTIRGANISRELQDIAAMFKGSSPDGSATRNRRDKNTEAVREKLRSGTLEGLTEKLEELRQKEADVLAAGKSRGRRGRLNSLQNKISQTELEIEELQNKPEDEEETLSATEKRRRSRLPLEERDTQSEEETTASGPDGTGTDGTDRDDADRDDADRDDADRGDGSLFDEYRRLLGDGMNIGLGDGSAVKAAKEALADMGEPPELAEQPDFWNYLTRAGLAIAAGKSDDPLANIAEGVLMTFNQKAKDDKEFRDAKFMRYLKTREQKAKDLDILLTAENVDSLKASRVIEGLSKIKAAEAQAAVLKKDEERIRSLQDQGYGIFSADIAGAGGSELLLRTQAQESIAQEMVKNNPSLINGQPFKPTADSDFFIATRKSKDGTGPITIRKAKPNEITITQVSQ